MLFVCHPKILHKHCLQFLLAVKMAPRETENNAYAKFWYVMVFSRVVNFATHGEYLISFRGYAQAPFFAKINTARRAENFFGYRAE